MLVERDSRRGVGPYATADDVSTQIAQLGTLEDQVYPIEMAESWTNAAGDQTTHSVHLIDVSLVYTKTGQAVYRLLLQQALTSS